MERDDQPNEAQGRREEAKLPPMPLEIREVFQWLLEAFARAVAADPGLLDRLMAQKEEREAREAGEPP